MNVKLTLGIYGLEHFHGGDMRAVIDLVGQAEAMGYDQMNITDHVVMGENTHRYPYGEFSTAPDANWWEPVVIMSAIAAATRTIRLGTGILIGPLRSAVLLAKQAATLDALSGGRLDLGLGTGWQREEYEASGIPFEDRGQRLRDQVAACKVLWRDAPANFSSETTRFENIYCRPAPVQPGGVPLWFGLAPTDANRRLIVEHGVGWLPIFNDPQQLRAPIAQLREEFAAAGRDSDELQVRATLNVAYRADGSADIDASLANAEAQVAAGVTQIEMLPVALTRKPEEIVPVMQTVAQALKS